MAEKLITAPTVEPVTLPEAKAQLYVTDTADDMLITSKIKAARWLVEKYLNRALVQQTWKLQLDAFPAIIRLARPPLNSISSIQYVDTDGTTQSLDTSKYQVDNISEPARIVPAYGETWPNTRGQIGAVTVTYVAGYDGDGASPEDLTANIPQTIKDAILLLVTELYENREVSVIGTILSYNSTIESLLFAHRVRPIIP